MGCVHLPFGRDIKTSGVKGTVISLVVIIRTISNNDINIMKICIPKKEENAATLVRF